MNYGGSIRSFGCSVRPVIFVGEVDDDYGQVIALKVVEFVSPCDDVE